jgi:hypothetical protein
MPGNHDSQNDEVRQGHKKRFKTSAKIALVLLALSALFAAPSTRTRGEVIGKGAKHLGLMRPGFAVGNFTVIPRESLEQKENCAEVNRVVRRALANNQTNEVNEAVEQLCPKAMWLWIDESGGNLNGVPEETSSEVDVVRMSDRTPCKVYVKRGTDKEQVAELNALDSVCKILAVTFEEAPTWLYSVGFTIAALLLLYSSYHGKKAFCGTRPEEQPLLRNEGQGQKGERKEQEEEWHEQEGEGSITDASSYYGDDEDEGLSHLSPSLQNG